MNKYLHTIIAVTVVSFLAVTSSVIAEITQITYPIPELENCDSQKECSDFCNNPENHMTCVSWAESAGIFDDREAKRMKDINQMQEHADGKNVDPIYGPGGCTTPSECDSYCSVLENLDECMQHSVDNGYISSEEADEIKAVRDRGGPGGCSNEQDCKDFCNNPDNMEICMDFVVEEGKLTREEADFLIQNARMNQRPMDSSHPGGSGMEEDSQINEDKILQILENQEGPGGCKTIAECDVYCEAEGHMEECMGFARDHQLMSQEELERVEKMMTMEGPGGCKGPSECDAYCSQEEHMDECFNFVKDNDLMPLEDLDMMEKEMMIRKKLDFEGGPGGCESPSECDAYCNQPENREECTNFSIDSGMVTREEMQRMDALERKMDMRKEEAMEGDMMLQDGTYNDDIMFPSDDGMMPSDGDMHYDNTGPSDGDMHYDNTGPSDGDMYYDNTEPSNGDMYYDNAGSSDEDIHYDNAESSEGEIYYDNTTSPEGEIYYDNTGPSDGDMNYDETTSPPDESYDETPSDSQSKGLFQPLFNQVETLLANVGLLFDLAAASSALSADVIP